MDVDGTGRNAFEKYRNRRRSSESSDTTTVSEGRSEEEETPEEEEYSHIFDSLHENFNSLFEERQIKMADVDLKLARVEIFYGQKEKDTITAKAWAEGVDYAKKVTNMNDERLAAYAATSLRGEASIWLQSLRERENAALNSWPDLKRLFLEWFHDRRTASQRQELQRSLKQKNGETVRAFFNRVDIACFSLEEDWPQPPGDFNNDRKYGFKAAIKSLHDVMHKDFFLAGLRNEIRDVVLTSNPTSIKEALDKALDVESSIREKAPARSINELQVAAMNVPQPPKEEKIDHIVAAVVKEMNKGGFQPTGKDKKKDTRECFYCGIEGHIEPKCMKKKADAEKNIYNPHNPERSRRPKPKQQASAVTRDVVTQQPKVAAPAGAAHAQQQQQQRSEANIYDAIASGNEIWDY